MDRMLKVTCYVGKKNDLQNVPKILFLAKISSFTVYTYKRRAIRIIHIVFISGNIN